MELPFKQNTVCMGSAGSGRGVFWCRQTAQWEAWWSPGTPPSYQDPCWSSTAEGFPLPRLQNKVVGVNNMPKIMGFQCDQLWPFLCRPRTEMPELDRKRLNVKNSSVIAEVQYYVSPCLAPVHVWGGHILVDGVMTRSSTAIILVFYIVINMTI